MGCSLEKVTQMVKMEYSDSSYKTENLPAPTCTVQRL